MTVRHVAHIVTFECVWRRKEGKVGFAYLPNPHREIKYHQMKLVL